MKNNIIIIKQMYKEYGKNDGVVHALNGVELMVKKGEMLAIMGESGSGKSTMLNIIGLLDELTSGEYLLEGTNVSTYNEKQKAFARNSKFGFIVQDFALVEKYTVKQNVEIPFSYSYKKIKKEEREKIINSVLKQMLIYEKKDKLVCELSGGQRQRVAIARALVMDPEIILADEPTGALDSKTSIEIMEVLSRLHKEGKTVIIITHSDEVAKFCDRVIKLSDGKIVD